MKLEKIKVIKGQIQFLVRLKEKWTLYIEGNTYFSELAKKKVSQYKKEITTLTEKYPEVFF